MRKFTGLLFVLLLIVLSNLTVGAHASKNEATNASPDTVTQRSRSKVLMAYYAGWSSLEVSNIPADKLTHVVYAFSDLDENGECTVLDDNAEPNMAAFKELKEKFPHLKVLISIGGWD